MPANTPARDFLCESCGHPYELKATKQSKLGRINDGAYEPMMERIRKLETPTFLLMRYAGETVAEVATVHHTFITAESIFRRKPLPQTARRAGWVGCNIILEAVPVEGKIGVVENTRFKNRELVREQFQKISALSGNQEESRSWMAAVLTIVQRLPGEVFSLDDVYRFEPQLSRMFPNNHHVREKIRQQLQVLRNAGLVVFIDNHGTYKLTGNPVPSNLLR